MKKNKGGYLFVLVFFFSLIVFCFSDTTVYGEILPEGMVIGDDQGLNATKNGEYFVNVTDVMPGKTWHTTISIVNMEKDIPYQLSMDISPPTVSGSLDLSKAVQMTLTYEGKVVYEGPASGVSKEIDLQKKRLDLGTFKAGDSRALEVEYSLSGEYTKQDFVQKNVFDNVWTFYAVKTKKGTTGSLPNTSGSGSNKSTNPITGLLPQTGEEWRQAMLFVCVGLLLILILLFVWKNRKESDQ